MAEEDIHIRDSARPIIQMVAAPDLNGNWSLELQVAFLDGRKAVHRGLGAGRTAAGMLAGFIELLQLASDAGLSDLPTASNELWLAANLEARQ